MDDTLSQKQLRQGLLPYSTVLPVLISVCDLAHLSPDGFPNCSKRQRYYDINNEANTKRTGDDAP